MVKPRHFCVGGMAFLVVVGMLAFGCDSGNGTPQSRSSTQVPSPPPPPPPGVVWQPDTAILDQLLPYQDVEGYQVRPPKGWGVRPVPSSSNQKNFSWCGPRRADVTLPEVQILLITIPPASQVEFKGATLEKVFDLAFQGVSTTNRNIRFSDKEGGQVNGVPFMRAKTTDRFQVRGGGDLSGVMYVGRDETTIFVLQFFDGKSHYDESVKLGTAAILTFRKKP